MTNAQVDAIDKIKEILIEHFDASVLFVQYEISDAATGTEPFWHGGYPTARGLVEIGLEQMIGNSEPDDE